WTSNISGFFGQGSSVTTSSLPAGTHVITAKATDNVGLTGQASITITINAPTGPTYCDARGNTSSYEWIKTVSIGSWSNTSNNNGGYGNYVGAPPVSVVTGANSITFTPGFS